MHDLIQEGNKYYHKVTNGQTLWTISKKYGVDIKTLQRLNDLKSVSVTDKDYILVFVK